jgi:hypothetical protein
MDDSAGSKEKRLLPVPAHLAKSLVSEEIHHWHCRGKSAESCGRSDPMWNRRQLLADGTGSHAGRALVAGSCLR